MEIRGLASDNVTDALREMDTLASGTQCENSFYHANLNPKEHEKLTPQQWEQSIDLLEKNLGLEGQSRIVVEHEKHGRTHRHVIWSRIDVDSMTAISDSHDFDKHQKTARELESRFGLEAVASAHERDESGRQKERRPKNWETFRGQKKGVNPKQVKEEVSGLWRSSDSGAAFKAALEDRGYVLCRGDKRDFALIDKAGDEHNLARRVEGVKTADLRARLDGIKGGLPSVAEGRSRQRTGTPAPATSPASKPSGGSERIKLHSTTNARQVSGDERKAASWRERWGVVLGRARDAMRERIRAAGERLKAAKEPSRREKKSHREPETQR